MATKKNTWALVEKAKQGNREALDTLLEENRSLLEYIIRRRLGELLRQKSDVEDIYQETALRAFRSLGNFQYRDDDSFFRWITSIALHVIGDQVRRRQRRPERQLPQQVASAADSPSKGPRREERLSRLRDALDGLAPDYREVVTLAWLKGLQIEAIAERMNRSPGAVRKLLLRAVRKLRSSFGNTESLRLPDGSLLDEESQDA